MRAYDCDIAIGFVHMQRSLIICLTTANIRISISVVVRGGIRPSTRLQHLGYHIVRMQRATACLMDVICSIIRRRIGMSVASWHPKPNGMGIWFVKYMIVQDTGSARFMIVCVNCVIYRMIGIADMRVKRIATRGTGVTVDMSVG
jgi:hypothetical protein